MAINPDTVIAVLLIDGWHEVTDLSFNLDVYAYAQPPNRESMPPLHGFAVVEADGATLRGPLTSILAVRTRHD